MKACSIGFIVFCFVLSSVAGELSVQVRANSQDMSKADFPEDYLQLVLKDGKRTVATEYFSSSYGMADAQIVKDAKGTNYVVLRYGEGRGTHARSEFIALFRIGKRLNKVVTFPLNGPAGEVSDWEFKYSIEKPKTGGLRFTMTRHISGNGAFVYPEDKRRTLFVE